MKGIKDKWVEKKRKAACVVVKSLDVIGCDIPSFFRQITLTDYVICIQIR